MSHNSDKKDTSLIPHGIYCYGHTGAMKNVVIDGVTMAVPETAPCPYWSRNKDQEEQNNGYCSFLESGDWEDDGIGLLWDQVKACGVHDDLEIPD